MTFDSVFWVLMETFTLLFLLAGLAGLIIPVFPGLVVMWIVVVVYAISRYTAETMTTAGWVIFSSITLLMIVGSTMDNVIIARHVRERNVPWISIGAGFLAGLIASIFLTPIAGLVAAPAGLFLAEAYRLKDRKSAFESTRAWMTGWGWSFAARFIIGIVMVGLWMIWAWA